MRNVGCGLRIENEMKMEADRKGKNILALAIARYAGDYVADKTVSMVPLPNEEMKGRIIGREGRNIRAIEAATGGPVMDNYATQAELDYDKKVLAGQLDELGIARQAHAVQQAGHAEPERRAVGWLSAKGAEGDGEGHRRHRVSRGSRG